MYGQIGAATSRPGHLYSVSILHAVNTSPTVLIALMQIEAAQRVSCSRSLSLRVEGIRGLRAPSNRSNSFQLQLFLDNFFTLRRVTSHHYEYRYCLNLLPMNNIL